MSSLDIAPHELNQLIELIYAGARETTPWQRALESMRRHLQAKYVTLILRPSTAEDPGFMVNAGPVSTWAVSAYGNTYYALDPFVGLPLGEVHTVEEILGAENWRNSAFYQQFNAPLDTFHILGADLQTDDGSQCRLRVCRSPQADNFSASDKALCTLLLPHVRQSLEFYGQFQRSEAKRQLYAATVERLQIGTVILDEERRVLEINQTAWDLLREHDGLTLADNTLQASYGHDNRALQRLIRQTQTRPNPVMPNIAEAITLTRPSGRGSVGVVVQGLPRTDGPKGRRPALVVYLRDPERKPSVRHQTLRQLFGFTQAEAALAIELAYGSSQEQAGERLNIRRNTVKAHLRSIYAKAGVTRQSELTYLLHSSVAALGGEVTLAERSN